MCRKRHRLGGWREKDRVSEGAGGVGAEYANMSICTHIYIER